MARAARRSAVLILAFPLWARAAEADGATPLADDPTLVALAVALSCADAPDAVAAPPAASPGVASDGPELELVATVRARSLRFDEVPHVDVKLSGNGSRKTVWKTERVNLPMHPQAGVTYHDVQVRLTISSDVGELTSLLRQAHEASRGIRIEGDGPAAAVRPSMSTPTPTSTPTSTPTPAAAPAPAGA